MNIKTESRLRLEGEIAALYEDLNRFYLDNRERVRSDIRHYEDAAAEQRLKYAGMRLLIAFYPFVLDRAQADYIRGVSEAMIRLMEKTTRLFLEEEAVRKAFRFGPEQTELVEVEPGYRLSIPCARLDSYFDGRRLRFSEINTDGAAGMDGADKLAKLYLAEPTIREFFSSRPPVETYDINHCVLQGLLECYRQFSGGDGAPKPSIAVVDWEEARTSEEFVAYAEFFEKEGHEAFVADPRELDYDGRSISHHGRKIDIIYRRVVSTEYIERLPEVEAMTRAFKDHRVCVVGSFRSDVAFSKRVFAVVQDPRFAGFFTEQERALVAEHVPWTRALEDTECEYRGRRGPLPDLARERKDAFVVKPSNLYEGRGVKLGRHTGQEEWDALIEAALEGDYVLQELIPIPVMEVGAWDDRGDLERRFIHVGEYVFGGRFCGLYCRAVDVPVIDRTSKERMLPCLVLGSR